MQIDPIPSAREKGLVTLGCLLWVHALIQAVLKQISDLIDHAWAIQICTTSNGAVTSLWLISELHDCAKAVI